MQTITRAFKTSLGLSPQTQTDRSKEVQKEGPSSSSSSTLLRTTLVYHHERGYKRNGRGKEGQMLGLALRRVLQALHMGIRHVGTRQEGFADAQKPLPPLFSLQVFEDRKAEGEARRDELAVRSHNLSIIHDYFFKIL